MPIFPLKCTNEDCRRHFERICTMAELDETKCPACGADVETVMSVFGHYSIKGNNSASVTPKKYRGGK